MKKTYLAFLLSLLCAGNALVACTIISASLKGEVLAGGNEDYDNPFIKMWFNPPTQGRYGSVCFGFPDLQAQAAMNEHGLFFDFTAQEGIDPSKLNLKNPYYGDLFFEILGKCKNVAEALLFLKSHDYTFHSQALLADADGRSVIINAEAIVEKTGHYQINTNFNICNLKNKNYNCWRYDKAEDALSKATEISISSFKKILEITHQEGRYGTLYSNIYDLKRGLIYVYLYNNFDDVYVIDIKEELKKGYRIENLGDHFLPNPGFELLEKNHTEYEREYMLTEMEKKGIDRILADNINRMLIALEKGSATENSKIRMALVDAALVLIKKSYNRSSHGGAWDYWYDFPTSYDTWPVYDDQDLLGASKIFKSILDKTPAGEPPIFFIYEMYGYVNLLQGNKKTAKDYYEKCSTLAPHDSGNYKRSQKMLQKINLL